MPRAYGDKIIDFKNIKTMHLSGLTAMLALALHGIEAVPNLVVISPPKILCNRLHVYE
jgi:hypothetical protein